MKMMKAWLLAVLGGMLAGQAAPTTKALFPPVYYAAEESGKIIRYDDKGQPAWEFPAEMARDVQHLPNGNVLFCYNKKYNSKRDDNPSGVM